MCLLWKHSPSNHQVLFLGISKQKQAVKDKAKEAERKNSQAYSHKVCNLFEADMYIALLKIHVLYTFHRCLLR